MKKQDIQILLEKLNIELDEIHRIQVERKSILNLVMNGNFERILYLEALRHELEHLLRYFDRDICDEMEVPEGEKKSAKDYCSNLVVAIGNMRLDEIKIEDIQKVKSYQRYLRILDGDFNL